MDMAEVATHLVLGDWVWLHERKRPMFAKFITSVANQLSHPRKTLSYAARLDIEVKVFRRFRSHEWACSGRGRCELERLNIIRIKVP